MNNNRITQIALIVIVAGTASLATLITTGPKPEIINLTWDRANSTIVTDPQTGESLLVYSYMNGLMARYDENTERVKVTSTLEITPKMNDTFKETEIIQYYENITRHNGTVIWPIWNTSDNTTKQYALKTVYYNALWKGATIATKNETKTYNYSLQSYQQFQEEVASKLPNISWIISGQKNPATAIPPIVAIITGTTIIAYVKTKERRP